MRARILSALLATSIVVSAPAPALALASCERAERKVEEATALRHQAKEEARFGDHDRVCDTLDEVGDSYHDAQDAFRDCGDDVTAIDLRSELRALRIAKRVNDCD